MAAHITVTRMDVSPDLRHATAWIGVVGGVDGQQAVTRLQGLVGAFQAAIAKGLATKFTPRLHFRLDTNAQYAADIDQLLKQV